MAAGTGRPIRPRGRPSNDGPYPPLTRDTIIEAAMQLVSNEGFSALTMRSLAQSLGVTVRALYRHVTDRQQVIDLVAARILDLHVDHSFDVDDWRTGVRALYLGTRAAYRQIGRGVLFFLEETVSPTELPEDRILLPEQLLASLTSLGLSLSDALVWQQQFLTDVFGFALIVDYGYDRASEQQRTTLTAPVPAPWLDTHPDAPAPLSRRALHLPARSADDLFEQTIDRAIRTIETMRAAGHRSATGILDG
ncbi:TetR/AcrR family transcriptional regulator [Gordonia sp. (in: high G+C Gram-positive bacteria)]|uniref:TetR/AcrR family transcriptional regulator n=1 Tax=Gordonia sp. (in: high G+C Gram-positive bacteria) TaxID=84139 RepID=UPI0039E69030